MVNSQKYIIQNMERISAFDLETGACEFVIDDIQEATMTNEQETVYATGKNGVRIGSADRNKASRIAVTNGAIVDGVLAAQTGSDVVIGKTIVPKQIDIVTTADGTTASTHWTANGTVGAEIKFIYARNTDGTLGTKYAQAAQASATEFAYDPTTKVITLPTGKFSANDSIVCYYDIEVDNAKRFSNAENKYSKTVQTVADIFAKDICTGKSYLGKIIYFKAKASGNFDLTFGNDPSVQSMEFEALSGGCLTAGDKLLWDLLIFDEADIA